MLITSTANSAPTAPQNLAVISQRLPFAAATTANSATNNTNNSRTAAGSGTLSIFPPTSTRLISNKYEDDPPAVAATDSASSGAANNNTGYHSISDYHKQQSSVKSHYPYYTASSPHAAATATATLSLPGASATNSRRMAPDYSGNYSGGGAAATNGHPREGQAASLLGGKYLLLEEIEGASLHRCLHIESNMEYICKVGYIVLGLLGDRGMGYTRAMSFDQ